MPALLVSQQLQLDTGSPDCHKFKDEQDMDTKAIAEQKLKEIEEIAAGWGKLLAR